MRTLALVLAMLMCGCGVSITYGKPDAPPRPSSPEQACYERKRFAVGSADGEVEWSTGDGHYRTLVDGVVFYRDGKQLALPEVLVTLGDDELRETYAKRLEVLSRARRNYALLMTLGFVITAVGVASTTWTIRTQAEGLPITGSVALVGSGMALSIYARSRWIKWKGTHQVYESAFIDGTLGKRLDYDMVQHDRAVARSCGYEVVTVPDP